MLVTSVFLGIGVTVVSGLGWLRLRQNQLSTTPCPVTPVKVASGTLICVEGQRGALVRNFNNSEFIINAARYKGRDVTRLLQEHMEGFLAWEFRVSDELFGAGAEPLEASVEPVLVVEWEERV